MIEEKFEEDTQIIDKLQNKKRMRNSSLNKISKKEFNNDNEDENEEGAYSDDERKNKNRIQLNLQNLKKIANFQDINKKLRIVEPYRTLGVVIDNNQVAYFKRNTDRFMVASNHHSFLLYNLDKLKLERISPPLPHKISALAAYKNKVFTAVGDKILLWEKIHIIKTYEEKENNSEENSFDSKATFKKLITFDKLLLAQKYNGDLLIFDIFSTKLVKKLELNSDILIHPATYLNKVLFTKNKEQFQEDLNIPSSKVYLYNINTEKQIFEFDVGVKSDVCVIEQSPVIDVVGIGYSSGDIIIFNLKTLKKLLSFKSEYPVESLSFSSCANINISLLASGNPNGDISIWDLNKNNLHFTISHKNRSLGGFSSISSLLFLPNEPLLLATSGTDNSIKMYRIEANTGTPYLLKQRTGHSTHPHKIRFYGENVNKESFHILSLSEREFRNVSLLNEHMSKEFSFKNLPSEIKHEYRLGNNSMNSTMGSTNYLNFDFNEFRERDWANIVLNSRGCVNPLLLSYENSSVDETFANIKSKTNCTCVCTSMCGNFGFAGFEEGNIEKFNMQSGLNRWNIKAHDKAVIAVKSDGINSMLISISLDNTLKFWDFLQGSLVHKIDLPALPDLLEINKDNELIAVTLINRGVQIYDKSNFKMVREFSNFNGKNSMSRINDLTFSKDGKWLITVSDDKSLKIYDILSSQLIEWINFKQVPISVTISPNNQYIALSFVNLQGIYLWLNRSLFVDLIDIEDVKGPLIFDVPFNTSIKTIKSRKELYEEEIENENREEEKNKNLNKLEKNKKAELNLKNRSENNKLIQLSQENKMKFRILNHLEKIQERNDPKIKKKEKVKAPFFLFNINNIGKNDNQITQTQEESPEFMNILKNYSHFKNEKMVKKKKVGVSEEINEETKKEFILPELLKSYNNNKIRSNEITLFLNSLNPYMVDLEIRNMDPLLNENSLTIEYFLDYILEEIRGKTNFELVQAYLNRFLKVKYSN